jgi:hypothetical protein
MRGKRRVNGGFLRVSSIANLTHDRQMLSIGAQLLQCNKMRGRPIQQAEAGRPI